MDKLFFVIILIFCLSKANAQIKDVSFQLQYDKDKSVFNCYLIVNKGDAYSKKNRIQYNSQLTIVTPKNSVLKMVESFSPLQDNAYLNGVKPLKWFVGNELKNISTINQSNIFSIIPTVSPTAYYNNLDQNSVVKLFSFSVSPMPECAQGVRLFDNNSDNGISTDEAKGGDFSNTISIGGLHSIVSSNRSSINSLLPIGTTQSIYNSNSSETLYLKAGDWENAAYFTWVTPDGKTLVGKDQIISNAKTNQSGVYKLIVTSNEGCSLENEVKVSISEIQKEALLKLEKPEQNFDFESRLRSQDESQTMVFPNPAKDHLNYRIRYADHKDYVIDIVDIHGTVVKEKVCSGKTSSEDHVGRILIDLSSGLYILRLTVDQKTIEHTFLVLE